MTVYVLTERPERFDKVASIGRQKRPELEFIHCPSIRELLQFASLFKERDVLLSYCFHELIPVSVFKFFKTALNIHVAPPSRPGLDGHFYAAYEGEVTEYGATTHIMNAKFDDGEILDVELVPVDKNASGWDLAAVARACSIKLIERLFENGFKKNPIIGNISWGGKKTKRTDFLSVACRILPTDSTEEVKRKFHAFQEGVPFKNLYIDLHGLRFRFEKVIEDG
ncbi:MAG: hypothetical protein LBD15_01475 [Holosporales bacterium]|nr:hypothetical protein [Holosporales bacterium]